MLASLRRVKEILFAVLKKFRRQEGTTLPAAILTTALEAAANAVIVVDRNGQVRWVNSAFLKLSGYNAEEILGSNSDTLRMRQDPLFYPSVWQHITAGRVWKDEYINRRRDGSHYVEEMTVTPVQDCQGEITHFIAIRQDVTQRRQTVVALERYQLLAEYARDIIFISRSDGLIVEANAAALKAYGYSRAEFLTLSIHNLRASGLDYSIDERLQTALKQGIAFESRHIRRDGATFPVEISAVGATIGGERLIINIIRDISDRKEAEAVMAAAREQIARAERLAALGTMAAGIAHEINQPLNSVKVTVDSLLYWYKKGRTTDKAELVQDLTSISEQADRIDKIIKHVRSFARMEQAKPEPTDLNQAVNNSLALLGHQLASHSVTVKKLLSPAVIAQGSPIQFEEVVINLVINAMQALELRGRTNKEITVATFFHGDKAVLEVSDNGGGISPDIEEKIFSPFFTTKPIEVGTGLGLSIVQSIVTSFGGAITAFNNDKGGATFQVRFLAAVKNEEV